MRRFALRRYPLSSPASLGLLVLLILPIQSFIRLAAIIPYYAAPAAMAFFSLVVYLRLAHDKKRAVEHEWRVPESSLHFLELVGGWPGSFVAQRRFRHKISKTSYQFTFWLIVVVYQVVALDCISNWKWSRTLVTWISEYKPG